MTSPQTLDIISTKQKQIAQLAKQKPGTALRSLSHHLDLDWLREAFRLTRKDGAAGVDGQTAVQYAGNLETNLQSLLNRAKSGQYRAPCVRRVQIPKGNGATRPIGIPTFEDKVLQRAVVMLLEPVFEQDFYNGSFGFRPNRSAHDALESLMHCLWQADGDWVLEVDIRCFFDMLDHEKLQDIFRQRVVDGVIARLVGKWLKAGVMERGVTWYPDSGTPQGGVVSPLLANVYLNEVIDQWWVREVLPRLRGRGKLIRYADDLVLLFSNPKDADRVKVVLAKRLCRFGLELHPEKTRMVRYQRPDRITGRYSNGERPGSFDFLGFTHFWGRSSKGNWKPSRKTSKSRFSRACKTMNQWLRRVRHWPVNEQAAKLQVKLRGHFNYYGIRDNSAGICRFRHVVIRLWQKWLGRRSQRARLTWDTFSNILKRNPLPPARLCHGWLNPRLVKL